MAIPTEGSIESVEDKDGTERPPADSDKQRDIRDRLGNFDSVEQFVYSTSGTNGEALDPQTVPDGVTVLVEYAEGNAGNVYVGDSTTQQAPLTKVGDARTFDVTDTSAIHVRTPTSGDSVVVTFES